MTPGKQFNADQYASWNGAEGEYWTKEYERMDRILSPVTAPLMEFAGARRGSTVMDIGCGCSGICR